MNKYTTVFISIIFLLTASSIVFAGELVIKGSTTVLPIAQKTAEAYMAEHPDVKISLSGGGSGNGIKAIIDGTRTIIQYHHKRRLSGAIGLNAMRPIHEKNA